MEFVIENYSPNGLSPFSPKVNGGFFISTHDGFDPILSTIFEDGDDYELDRCPIQGVVRTPANMTLVELVARKNEDGTIQNLLQKPKQIGDIYLVFNDGEFIEIFEEPLGNYEKGLQYLKECPPNAILGRGCLLHRAFRIDTSSKRISPFNPESSDGNYFVMASNRQVCYSYLAQLNKMLHEDKGEFMLSAFPIGYTTLSILYRRQLYTKGQVYSYPKPSEKSSKILVLNQNGVIQEMESFDAAKKFVSKYIQQHEVEQESYCSLVIAELITTMDWH